ncbi:MAG TPA: SGNH/GDSL hydrolase family protein [Vicinamibacterales bacterium]
MQPTGGPEARAGRIVLLGDSVFDNQSYVARGAATTDALVARLPPGWTCTLLAQDGSVIDEVARQLMHLPSDASQLVVSTGGNDALSDAGILSERATSVGEGLWKLGQVADRFERRYRDMLGKVRARRLPALVCTIYNGDFADADVQRVTATALTVFNDAIIRATWSAGLPILDLRSVCDEPEDYVNEIEPSARGGQKIADAIVRALG